MADPIGEYRQLTHAMSSLDEAPPKVNEARAAQYVEILLPQQAPTSLPIAASVTSASWNAWMEPEKKHFSPVEKLAPGQIYRLRLHLAAFSYKSAGVLTGAPGKKLGKWIDNLPRDTEKIELEALLIFDERYFEKVVGERQKPFVIKVGSLRRTLNSFTFAGASNPMRKLEQGGEEQTFVYGHVDFLLRTKDSTDIPSDGSAAVAISVWDRDNNTPLDEISFSACIQGATCPAGAHPKFIGIVGNDSLLESLGQPSIPELAINLLELNNGNTPDLWGVLRAKGGDYYSWRLDQSFNDLRGAIKQDLANLYKATEQGRLDIGKAMVNALFPPNAQGSKSAKQEFINTLAPFLTEKPYATDILPSIYFRVGRLVTPEPSLWPIPLMAIRIAANGSEEVHHLGRYFRIESPLGRQYTDTSQSCTKDWIVVGPAQYGGTKPAWTQLMKNIKQEDLLPDQIPMGPARRIGDVPLKIIDDMSIFKDFMQRGPSSTPTLLTILSHHNDNQIWFDTTVFPADLIEREFEKPSIAILMGCNTGIFGDGASGFIRNLNLHGIYAAIATMQEIDAEMAGDYFDCFLTEIESAPTDGIPIGELHTKTLRCLEKINRWGSKTLFFSILGNTGLKICKPERIGL